MVDYLLKQLPLSVSPPTHAQIPSRLYNSAAAEPFLNGTNSGYVEEMYNNWLRDPASVHAVSFHTRGLRYSFNE